MAAAVPAIARTQVGMARRYPNLLLGAVVKEPPPIQLHAAGLLTKVNSAGSCFKFRNGLGAKWLIASLLLFGALWKRLGATEIHNIVHNIVHIVANVWGNVLGTQYDSYRRLWRLGQASPYCLILFRVLRY